MIIPLVSFTLTDESLLDFSVYEESEICASISFKDTQRGFKALAETKIAYRIFWNIATD